MRLVYPLLYIQHWNNCPTLCVLPLQLLDEQFQDYFTENFYNPDFKYHQSQLDIQILCNRRIRQNLREAREMYADRHNPWYSRKKFQTEKVSSDHILYRLVE